LSKRRAQNKVTAVTSCTHYWIPGIIRSIFCKTKKTNQIREKQWGELKHNKTKFQTLICASGYLFLLVPFFPVLFFLVLFTCAWELSIEFSWWTFPLTVKGFDEWCFSSLDHIFHTDWLFSSSVYCAIDSVCFFLSVFYSFCLPYN
jgi:hypothetical protein